MSVIILGTDTDAGKTTFALLWLAAHPECAYWKPIETGDSDSQRVRALVPTATVFEPLARFRDPVAPPLAARREGKAIPWADDIDAHIPSHSHLLIETFGGPFSPLNEAELQVELIAALGGSTILVGSSALGAVGRTLALLQALVVRGIRPAAVVLIGDDDEYARKQIEKHSGIPVFALEPPATFDAAAIQQAARMQQETLQSVRSVIAEPAAPASMLSGAAGADLLVADRRTIWHPYTSLRDPDPPLPVVAAEREFLQLADGRRIIDGISSWWTILHGHREPRLMAALREAAKSFDHVLFAGVTHPPAIRVAELLLRTAPWLGGRVFFSDDGSTAVEVALKMAYQVWRHRGEPERTLFVGFENGYHGDTFGAMAVGRDPLFTGAFEPLLFRTERVPVSAERLDDLLKRKGNQVAAVIIEPLVQGAGGMQMHSPEELRAIFEVTRRHGVLFIADEVMTGCHRTGTFWAFQAADITPDLICTAKTLAGGVLPLAATLASPEIVAAFDTANREWTFFHGHSFTAHPLSCAVAAANLEWLLREPPTAPQRFERFWTEALGSLRGRPRVKDVRIRGTIAAIELDLPGGYLAEAGRAMRQRCLEQGVFLRPLGNVLYALPPFGTSDESLNRVAEAMCAAVLHTV
jgi:adenosylmethionine-8-amino-7-oxononanoate transaminase/dethiobiotin synthase